MGGQVGDMTYITAADADSSDVVYMLDKSSGASGDRQMINEELAKLVAELGLAPVTTDAKDLGTTSKKFRRAYFSDDVNVAGNKVLGAQGAAVAAISIAYTANVPSITLDNTVVIADGSAPTVNELLELCVELKNQIETLKARCEAHGLIAT